MSVELPSSLPEEGCRYMCTCMYVYQYCNAHTFIYAHCVYTVYVHMCYVLVITCLRGMLLVYGHETRGRVAPEGGVSINRNIPIRHVLIDL